MKIVLFQRPGMHLELQSFPLQQALMHGGRHGGALGSSISHGMRVPSGVQHGRVSDLTKKRLAEARIKAAQAQLKM